MKKRIVNRREMLKIAGLSFVGSAFSSLLLPACGTSTSFNSTATDSAATSGVTTSSCGVIPSETAGPYPAHDDSAINALRLSGIVRSDIRASLNTGGYTGSAVATGLPLNLTLNLVNASNGCTPLAGYAIYLWHCNINGGYSMYSSGISNETYLRGVQVTDSQGAVNFQSIFPGCYDGRITHIHFEIYPSLGQAVDDYYVSKTSQLTFPMSTMDTVYSLSSYSGSKSKLAQTSYSKDMVFADGTTYQMASVSSASTTAGVVAQMNVGIAV